jgi:hypothetical protein
MSGASCRVGCRFVLFVFLVRWGSLSLAMTEQASGLLFHDLQSRVFEAAFGTWKSGDAEAPVQDGEDS